MLISEMKFKNVGFVHMQHCASRRVASRRVAVLADGCCGGCWLLLVAAGCWLLVGRGWLLVTFQIA